MKTILKCLTLLIFLFVKINASNSQGNGALQNYYETMKYYLSIYHPQTINQQDPPYGRVYFDLSPINSNLLDASVAVNANQTFISPSFYWYRNGNWNSNQGGGIFSSPNQDPFFPTYTFISTTEYLKLRKLNFLYIFFPEQSRRLYQ